VILLVAGICGGCGGGQGKPQRTESNTESAMAESTKNPPLSSTETKALYSEAIAIARGSNQTELSALKQKLGDGAFLAKLDNDEAYRGKMERLRVAGILQALSENKAPPARVVLTSLITNQVFLSHRSRVVLLIRALEPIRPATPEVVGFWDKHCQPDDGYSNVTMDTVIKNGTAPALVLFEKNIPNAAHPQEDRYSWLVIYVLQRRNDLPLLQSCDRVLMGRLDQEHKTLLADVLLDYKPDDWFRACGWVKPPPRMSAGVDSLKQLRVIAKRVEGDKTYPEPLRKQAQAVTEEINERLKDKG